MAGCRSCSSRSAEAITQPTKKAEKLEKGERSDNPRYPLVFVGKRAFYSDEDVQMIVTVVEDQCDDDCDCFVLSPERILRDSVENYTVGEPFHVTQPAGEKCWKLRALI